MFSVRKALLPLALWLVCQQVFVFGVPQQCLRVYRRVASTLPPMSAIVGAEKLANDVNKAVFMVFDEFIEFFHDEVQRIYDEKYPYIDDEGNVIKPEVPLPVTMPYAAEAPTPSPEEQAKLPAAEVRRIRLPVEKISQRTLKRMLKMAAEGKSKDKKDSEGDSTKEDEQPEVERKRKVDDAMHKFYVDKVKEIVLALIDEFGARERQTYMRTASYNRDLIDFQIKPKGYREFLEIIKVTVKTVGGLNHIVSDIKEVYFSTFNGLMEVCDQSLMGLLGLIAVFEAHVKNEEIKDFDPNVFNLKQNHRHYTHDDRMEYVEHIQRMKSFLTQKYFDYELKSRMNRKTGNFYNMLMYQITRTLAANTKEDLKQINASFETFKEKYIDMHEFENDKDTMEEKRAARAQLAVLIQKAKEAKAEAYNRKLSTRINALKGSLEETLEKIPKHIGFGP